MVVPTHIKEQSCLSLGSYGRPRMVLTTANSLSKLRLTQDNLWFSSTHGNFADEMMPSLTQLLLIVRRTSRVLWVRVTLFVLFAIFVALSAPALEPVFPAALRERFSIEATVPLLNILANGLLAVVTFALGVMVSSHRALASATTPRIHRLLMDDTTTQSTLATFIGGFVYSLVSIILYHGGYHVSGSAVSVFLATVFVNGLIIFSLVRWVNMLSRFGNVDYSLERAEETARQTLQNARDLPNLGAASYSPDKAATEDMHDVAAQQSGYLLSVDVRALHQIAEQAEGKIYLTQTPGDHVLSGTTIMKVTAGIKAAQVADLVSIGSSRTYDQDPRFSLRALSETASKALSPGVNDAGTALEVIRRAEAILHEHFSAEVSDAPPDCPNVFLPPVKAKDLIEMTFRQVVRDGAGNFEILASVLEAYETLEKKDDASIKAAVASLRNELFEHAKVALPTEQEFATLTKAYDFEAG